MSTLKISQLAYVSDLTGDELVPVVSLGTTVKTTVGDISAKVQADSYASLNSLSIAASAFQSALAGTSGSTLVGYGSRTLAQKLGAFVDVKDLGAVGDGIHDDTSAIQSAISSLPGGGCVLFPQGTYKVTSQLSVAHDRVHLLGFGIGATLINFVPTSNQTCIKVENGSAVSYQGSIRGIGFYSTDTTHTKIAIQLIDHSGWHIENCGTVYPHWFGSDSIFLNVKGREAGVVQNIYVAADRPLLCEAIPSPHTAAGIGLDHHNFHNLYLIASAGHPVVEFGTGLNVTQVSFTGYQAWVGGDYGLYWNDTTSTAVSEGLVLNNIRFEQTSNTATWLVYINHNYSLSGLSIRGGQGGDRNGFYLRKVKKVHFDGFSYTSASLVALDADNTVDDIEGTACFWQAGSSLSLSGHDLVFATPKNPNTGALPPTFSYCLTSNLAQIAAGRTYTATIIRNSFTEVAGSGSIVTTGTYTFVGKLCFFQIKTVCTGGATIASTAGTSYYSGLPAPSDICVCQSLRYDNATSLGSSSISGGGVCTTPAWTAAANATYVTSGIYTTA